MVGWMQELRWVECKNFIKSETSICLNVQEAKFSRGLGDKIDRGASFSLWTIKISLQIVSMLHMNQWNNSLAVFLLPNWILHTLLQSVIFYIPFEIQNLGHFVFSSHEDTGAYLSNICANDVQTLLWRVQKPCCKKRSHGYKKSRSCKVGLMLTSSRVWVEEMPFFSHEERCYMKLSIFEASKDRDSWGVKLRPIYRQIISDLI